MQKAIILCSVYAHLWQTIKALIRAWIFPLHKSVCSQWTSHLLFRPLTLSLNNGDNIRTFAKQPARLVDRVFVVIRRSVHDEDHGVIDEVPVATVSVQYICSNDVKSCLHINACRGAVRAQLQFAKIVQDLGLIVVIVEIKLDLNKDTQALYILYMPNGVQWTSCLIGRDMDISGMTGKHMISVSGRNNEDR